jgi:hypothetical protein
MKAIILLFVLFFLMGCSPDVTPNVPQYFELVRKAELLICKEKYEEAVKTYEESFKYIDKPFGKDVFNAALASQMSAQELKRDHFLQLIINNSDEVSMTKAAFVGNYMTESDWQDLINEKNIDFNQGLRQEFEEIWERDQLFRPMYDTHDDTINANRKINLAQISAITQAGGFPSHQELGYTNSLRSQNHYIVLHHTAQRRSRDKSVIDLEPILLEAVNEGRFDPELAIYYLNFQNDVEKGRFEVYSTWQYQHPSLPDSLNQKVWLPRLSDEQRAEANEQRAAWHADSLEDIATKAVFLSKSPLPFIFSSVRTSKANLGADLNEEQALELYKLFANQMEEYQDTFAPDRS